MSFFQNLALVIFLFVQILLSVSKAESARISVNERVLIAVVNLHSMTHKKGLYPTLYRGEDLLARKVIRHFGKAAYSHVVILTGEDASLESFKETVKGFETDSTTKAIDVVFYLHGHDAKIYGRPELCFYSKDKSCIPSARLPNELSDFRKLRALYSDACFGSEQNQDLLASGFKVVAGSTLEDDNLMLDLKLFLKVWTKGSDFASSIHNANSTRLGQWLDRKHGGNSIKIVSGAELLQIDSPIP
jgi:hypothetical protein